MKTTLRILFTDVCNRHCEGCCNKQFDLANLPKFHTLENYTMIIVTGGEPMLFPDTLRGFLFALRSLTWASIILYTAHPVVPLHQILKEGLLDGVTVTLHENDDIGKVLSFQRLIEDNYTPPEKISRLGSMRLNIFKGVNTFETAPYWKVKDNIEWIENCPLPSHEEFVRI